MFEEISNQDKNSIDNDRLKIFKLCKTLFIYFVTRLDRTETELTKNHLKWIVLNLINKKNTDLNRAMNVTLQMNYTQLFF